MLIIDTVVVAVAILAVPTAAARAAVMLWGVDKLLNLLVTTGVLVVVRILL